MVNNLPTALEMKELTRTPLDNATLLNLRTLSALYTAATSSLTVQGSVTTASITIPAGTPETTVRVFYGQLHQAGFQITPVSNFVFTLTFQR